MTYGVPAETQEIFLWSYLYQKVKNLTSLNENEEKKLVEQAISDLGIRMVPSLFIEHFDMEIKSRLFRQKMPKEVLDKLFKVFQIKIDSHAKYLLEKSMNVNVKLNGENVLESFQDKETSKIAESSTVPAPKKKAFSPDEVIEIIRFILHKIEEEGCYDVLKVAGPELWREYLSKTVFDPRPLTSLVNKWRNGVLKGDVLPTLELGKDETLNLLQKVPIQLSRKSKEALEMKFSVVILLNDDVLESWRDAEVETKSLSTTMDAINDASTYRAENLDHQEEPSSCSTLQKTVPIVKGEEKAKMELEQCLPILLNVSARFAENEKNKSINSHKRSQHSALKVLCDEAITEATNVLNNKHPVSSELIKKIASITSLSRQAIADESKIENLVQDENELAASKSKTSDEFAK